MTVTLQFDYDLFVIGAGSGGVRAARMAANKGKKVAVAEERYLGGTCVNVGCVPKKLFVYASQFPELFHASKGFGWNQAEQPVLDWPTLRDNKTAEIERLNGIYNDLINNSGADLFDGRATVLGPQQVEVNGETYSVRTILVATGGWPFIPEFPGSEHAVSSNEMFFLDELPKRAVVVGGGYIAVEFAGILNGLGVDTHLVYRGTNLLKSFDREMSDKITQGMAEKGVNIHLSQQVTDIAEKAHGYSVTLDDQSSMDADLVLYATGRQANTASLGLENTAVELRSNGSIVVDEHFCTAEPSIYALGDVIDRVQLTPVAIQEAMVLVDALYGDGLATIDYDNIPTAVFCQPELGTVGLSEEDAQAKYADISVYTSDFKPMMQTLGGGNERITMKLIVDQQTDKVIGCHMVGDHAAEIIQGMGIALKAGATKVHFDDTLGIHPSAAEEFVTMREPTR
ncbi:MAG: glutathione-disulfide reductase [Porticoccaceae bacterium]|jgi:glutathione reductase (NADPH)|nr:glutathione-disulfide reductase [Porticoccaceae bacterium]MBT5004476.1 glutathione-disulfide reductase [Porticoccaceae bacterium]MBT5103081.1 glutathione-disulfide reductase [Porticoccaceae bacterium]MBT6421949.1 glutathione-disulfide reductase [Porticoccaceae bacterium]MBT6799798.1 glutathione-disulfide reductase [Porticoccaceae bacterium]